jgi:hypothetical protein
MISYVSTRMRAKHVMYTKYNYILAIVLVKVVSYDTKQLKDLIVCLLSVKGDNKARGLVCKALTNLDFATLVSLTLLYGKRISTGSRLPPCATFALLSKFYAMLFLFSLSCLPILKKTLRTP